MNVIWKTELSPLNNIVRTPKGAKLLDIQLQRGVPTLWFLANPQSDTVETTLNIYPTGQRFDEDPGEYLATFQTSTGLVFHVFDPVKT